MKGTINPLPPAIECTPICASVALTVFYGAKYIGRTESGAYRFEICLSDQFEKENPYLKDQVQTLDLMPQEETPQFLAEIKPGDILNIKLA